jgi:uncharacterized YccA/Bax inhibitor family protein
MALENPAFSRSAAFQNKSTATVATPSADDLQQMYESPTATGSDTNRMTVEDTIVKSAVSFAVLLVGAAIGWAFLPVGLLLPIALIGFAVALVNIFKKQISPALVLAYAGIQGLVVGGFSAFYELQFPGIVVQALLATVVVFVVTLALFASGKIRASKKATKVFLIAFVGYFVFSVVNFALMWTGVNDNPFGLRGSVTIFGIPFGLILGVLVVIMAAYSLVLDFDFIKQGVTNRAPRREGWRGAFGIVLTVVWLYLELLRIFAIARN